MIGLLFPGQGAQFVGMGQELADAFPTARRTFEEADDALGYSLSRVCFAGPEDRLTATDVCQPALVATSVAAWRVAAEHGLEGGIVLGHSLGEYSALVAAGSLPFDAALRLVAERGAAMQAAAEARPGTMLALLGMADEDVQVLCAEAGEAWPANYNCPGQVVASGTIEGIARLAELAAERGAKTAALKVGGSFHSPLMAPAADRLAPALAAWEPGPASPPFLSTTTCVEEPPERMRAVLLSQLTSPVRFGDAVEAALAGGVERFVELGPGRVLSGLVKRVRRDVPTAQVGKPDDLAALAVA
ncbi:MAG: [acyl-carrier-protein] S-malonyltransferase [Miltoncostaeaceae bacterium]|nr:[acyl-carrier-protein] S-malonyltransferase [Miltoncostaeaceae bacterium]